MRGKRQGRRAVIACCSKAVTYGCLRACWLQSFAAVVYGGAIDVIRHSGGKAHPGRYDALRAEKIRRFAMSWQRHRLAMASARAIWIYLARGLRLSASLHGRHQPQISQ